MNTPMLLKELAAARSVDIDRAARRARSRPAPDVEPSGNVRRRAGRLLIDVGRRLAGEG